MNSDELANKIISQCNDYAVVSRLHSANVAYVPAELFKNITLYNSIWKHKGCDIFLLNETIKVYIKKNLNTICVTYNKDQSDEMEESDIIETVDMNLIREYREAMKWKNNKL